MKINKISFKNLLSYGNKLTSYSFDSVETILISGKNGSGKTTLIDVIFFNLTGKSYRKVSVNRLINSKNKKKLETEGNYISSTGTRVKIIRNRKPEEFIIYINDKKQDQELSEDFQKRIETILEFNPKNLEKLFLISSVSYKPFLSSSPEEKRRLIDQLIEIESFTKMSDSCKKDRTIEKEKLKEIEFNIEKLKSNIDLIDEFNKKIDDSKTTDATEEIKELDESLQLILKQAEEVKKEKNESQEKLDKLNDSTNKLLLTDSKQSSAINAVQNKVDQLTTTLEVKRKDLKNKNKFFNENDSCITCEQEIENNHKEKITWEIEKQMLEFDEEETNIEKENKKLVTYKEKNSILKESIKLNQTTISGFVNLIGKTNDKQTQLKYEYKGIHSKKETLKSTLTKSIEKRDASDLIKQLNECYENRINCVNQLDIIETSIKMLGEKYLRSFSIDRYLPFINKKLNEYLEIFGLPFKIILDNEFKEKFLSRGYEKLSYNSLSEGEKKRVDLSLLFTFFDVSKLRSKESSNILVMDEICDSSLDVEAISGLSHIIDLLTKDNVTTILISHNSDVKELINFTKHINVTKAGSFSCISYV